jgi:hypothetical protein
MGESRYDPSAPYCDCGSLAVLEARVPRLGREAELRVYKCPRCFRIICRRPDFAEPGLWQT